MSDPITIPPAALEAAQDALAEHVGGHASKKAARAACLAMLENWPGMVVSYRFDDWGPTDPSIILPLTENSNDKG